MARFLRDANVSFQSPRHAQMFASKMELYEDKTDLLHRITDERNYGKQRLVEMVELCSQRDDITVRKQYPPRFRSPPVFFFNVVPKKGLLYIQDLRA